MTRTTRLKRRILVRRNPTVVPCRGRGHGVEPSRGPERREPPPEEMCPSCGHRSGVTYVEGLPHCAACGNPMPSGDELNDQ